MAAGAAVATRGVAWRRRCQGRHEAKCDDDDGERHETDVQRYLHRTANEHCPDTRYVRVKRKGKGFPYSIPSVGPGADPGVQAVSLQVTVSHPLYVNQPGQLSLSSLRGR